MVKVKDAIEWAKRHVVISFNHPMVKVKDTLT